MKTRFPQILAACAVLAFTSAVAGTGWSDEYETALAQAKKENKKILLDFTGSDWCGWCKKLDREVFSKPEFKEYADKNLVLVEVDFPRAKEQSATERRQNLELMERFGVQGYPTIVVLDGDGKKV